MTLESKIKAEAEEYCNCSSAPGNHKITCPVPHIISLIDSTVQATLTAVKENLPKPPLVSSVPVEAAGAYLGGWDMCKTEVLEMIDKL